MSEPVDLLRAAGHLRRAIIEIEQAVFFAGEAMAQVTRERFMREVCSWITAQAEQISQVAIPLSLPATTPLDFDLENDDGLSRPTRCGMCHTVLPDGQVCQVCYRTAGRVPAATVHQKHQYVTCGKCGQERRDDQDCGRCYGND